MIYYLRITLEKFSKLDKTFPEFQIGNRKSEIIK